MGDQKVEIVIEYASADQDFLGELEKSLKARLMPWTQLKEPQVILWDNKKILPGQVTEFERNKHWQQARIFILVLSVDFINQLAFSDEIKELMKRYDEKKVQVIPVLYRKCSFQYTPLSKLQPFPRVKPPDPFVFIARLTRYDREEALDELAEDVASRVKALLNPQPPATPVDTTEQAGEQKQILNEHMEAGGQVASQEQISEARVGTGEQSAGQQISAVHVDVDKQSAGQEQLLDVRVGVSEQTTSREEAPPAPVDAGKQAASQEPHTSSFAHGYALLIGVGGDLPVSVQDAKALYRLFTDPKRAGYPADHVVLLTEQDATRDGILQAFDRLIELANRDAEATVVVYFSGHGGTFAPPGGASEYFLLPYDYHPDLQEHGAVSGNEFGLKVQTLNARKLVVLLDCCHAGGIASLKDLRVSVKGGEQIERFKASPMPPDLPARLQHGSGQVIVASSRANEYSYAYPQDPYSVFTTCLIDALSGRAGGVSEGSVGILHVIAYLMNRIPTRTGGKQHPFLNRIVELDEDFVLCTALSEGGQVDGEPLTSGKRERLKSDLPPLMQSRALLSNKIHKLRMALILETDTSTTFKLRQQFQDAERELRSLDMQIDDLEQQLGS